MNTIRRLIGCSKQFFGSLIKHELIKDNPFSEEASAVGANPERMMMVPNEWIDHLIREITCESMKIIVAICCYGGLRSHEARIQRSENVDLVKGRMLVRSTKTPQIRTCPIFPELRSHLMRTRELAPQGAVRLQDRYKPQSNHLHEFAKDDREGGAEALAEAPSESQSDSGDRASRQVSGKGPNKLAGKFFDNRPQELRNGNRRNFREGDLGINDWDTAQSTAGQEKPRGEGQARELRHFSD